MPQASCAVCLASIYAQDVDICRCGAAGSGAACAHWRRHHDEIHGLCRSARMGCRMCSELWRYFFKEKTPEQYARDAAVTVRAGGGEQAGFGIEGPGFLIGHAVHVFHGSGTYYRVVELSAESASAGEQGPEDVVLALDFGISSPMIYEVEERRYILRKTSDYERLMTLFKSGLLNSDEGSSADPQDVSHLRWEWVRAWMTECESPAHHHICSRALQANQTASWFPTRILDVRAKLGPDGRKYYALSETATVTPEGHRYATLSHVWGSDQRPVYRTVRDNYDARIQNGILRDDLPACFQDALDVTDKLGIPYLWIDSLCIIQDDPIDCPTEAGSMDKVYSNSFLNLSATASSSSKDHLPSCDKTQRLHEPRFVNTAWTGRFAGCYQIFDPHLWSDRVTDTRLASRGWIFQERALAPRVLHFGFDQLLWECAQSERAEEFPLGLPQRFINSGRRDFKWHLTTDPGSDTTDNATDHHSRLLDQKWAVVLSNYTHCALTMPRDKLIAISGVAQVLAASTPTPTPYLAGLWASNLTGGLCWHIPRTRRTTQDLIPSGLYARRWEPSRRLALNGAPSWSWASVDGIVAPGPFVSRDQVAFRTPHGHAGFRMVLDVLEGLPRAHVVPTIAGCAFGAVDTQASSLRLRGSMYPLAATAGTRPGEPDVSFCFASSSARAAVQLDQPEPPDAVRAACFVPLVLSVSRLAGAELLVDVDPQAVREHHFDRVQGVVVVPVAQSGPAVWRRVGYLECGPEVLDELGGEVGELVLV